MLFSAKNDTGAVSVNYLVTLGATTIIGVTTAFILRRRVIRGLPEQPFIAGLIGYVLTVIGLGVLLWGVVFELAAEQLPNRLHPGIIDDPSDNDALLTVALIATLWVAFGSTRRAVRRARDSKLL